VITLKLFDEKTAELTYNSIKNIEIGCFYRAICGKEDVRSEISDLRQRKEVRS